MAASSIKGRLRADLKDAMQRRDRVEMSQIRTLIAAIENAEAVEAANSSEPKLGIDHDVARRVLSPDDVTGIISRERDELADTVRRYQELGLADESAEMENRLQIVARYLV